MAEAATLSDTPEIRERWGAFAWTEANAAKAKDIIARYPAGRQASAVMPLLFLAQRQVGDEVGSYGWLPIPVMEFVACELDMPYIRVLEVASFYTMYNLAPVGKYLVQVCGTTPCMLRGAEDLMTACRKRGMHVGRPSEDGLWTLMEVECLGACANAPMVQINDDNYEDLTPELLDTVLDALARGETPPTLSRIGRKASVPEGGPTTLVEMQSENHDYRGEWGTIDAR
jgi:NADH-quinone oxidoreductase subunit E